MPDWVIVGAMKCGTSSLYAHLASHPQVVASLKKEIHYFDVNHDQGTDWYRAHFPLSRRLPGGATTGEASPLYLFHPHVAGRLVSTVPSARVIVMLRNPVDRAVSHYAHSVRAGQEDRPLLAALEAEEERLSDAIKGQAFTSPSYVWWSYKARGLYAEQLSRFYDRLSRERVLVLKSESFFEDTQSALREVFEFVGLDADRRIFDVAPRNVSSNRVEVEAQARRHLEQFFDGPNRELASLVGGSFGWS